MDKGVDENSRNIRHAEKNRKSTCKFADKIACISKEFYEEIKEKNNLVTSPYSVISTFIICKEIDKDSKEFQVVSYGEGTKFVHSTLKDNTTPSQSIRDSHAEILARKGLQRWLLLQIKSFVNNPETSFFQLSERKRLQLKDGITLHFYSSSTPCGNSTLKKFYSVKQKATNYSQLSEYEWPSDNELPFTHFPAINQGQIAVLVKRIPSIVDHKEEVLEDKNLTKKKEVFKPPGTEFPGNNRGNILTCSDKISLWNCLGVQGSILSIVFEPIKVSTITIGRKFTKTICDRALVLRLQSFTPKFIKELSLLSPNYKIHYPAVLCSGVKLTNEVIESNDQDHYFDYYSFVWYKSEEDFNGEIINGKTGFLIERDSSQIVEINNNFNNKNNNNNNNNNNINSELRSSVATTFLFEEFRNNLKKYGETFSVEHFTNMNYFQTKINTEEYQQAKKIIFSHKKLFGLSNHIPLCLQTTNQ